VQWLRGWLCLLRQLRGTVYADDDCWHVWQQLAAVQHMENGSACNRVANGAAAVYKKVLKIAAAAEVPAAVQHVGNGSACNGCAAGSTC
jgi:DNA-binding FrmR family transcriptional regulator